MAKENKAVITAALAGARTSKEQNPAVPYLAGKTLARGNWELVERVVQIARLADREPATLAETQEIFNLPSKK